MALLLTDPQQADSRVPIVAAWGKRLVNDPRDLPFITLITWATLVMLPAAALLFVPGVFSWWLGGAYFAVNVLVFIDRYTLMLHNTSHRPLFRHHVRWLNHYVPVVLGPFFGQSPNTYFAHHVGMHHPENNLPEDLSSTMRFERDNAWHFLRYFSRFFFLILLELPLYLWRKRRNRLARRAFFGELLFLLGIALLSYVNWRATLCVFVAPFVFMRVGMMMGNWGQHAFIDPARPGDAYVNSITCINTRYNRRCFNDGYHIGHHVKATRHWTEMPGDLAKNVATYAERGAIVFEGIDFFQVSMMLLTRRYDALARRIVRLPGDTRSHEELVSMLRARTRPFEASQLAAFTSPTVENATSAVEAAPT